MKERTNERNKERQNDRKTEINKETQIKLHR